MDRVWHGRDAGRTPSGFAENALDLADCAEGTKAARFVCVHPIKMSLVSAIYRCHWGGRRAGAKPPGVAQRPTRRRLRPQQGYFQARPLAVGPLNPVT